VIVTAAGRAAAVTARRVLDTPPAAFGALSRRGAGYP
jgi:hypothetical protein